MNSGLIVASFAKKDIFFSMGIFGEIGNYSLKIPFGRMYDFARSTGQHSAYFGHVTPPSGEGQSWIFQYQMKDILREKRIFDFGGKIPTRWFPMRETSSQFLSLATQLLLQEWLNPKHFDIISKLVIGRRELFIWLENSNSLIPYEENKFPILNIGDVG